MTRRVLLVAYAVMSVANVAAEAVGERGLGECTKACLMPLLLAWLLVVLRRGRIGHAAPRWLAAGLVFAWLGDLFCPEKGPATSMAGLAAFLAMQVCYIVSFTRCQGPGSFAPGRSRPCVRGRLGRAQRARERGGGALRIPVLIYSVS